MAASLAALLWCGCVVMALAAAAAAQGPRLPSAYKTLSGKPRSVTPPLQLSGSVCVACSASLRAPDLLFVLASSVGSVR